MFLTEYFMRNLQNFVTLSHEGSVKHTFLKVKAQNGVSNKHKFYQGPFF